MKKLLILLSLLTLNALAETVLPMKNGQFFLPDDWLLGNGQQYHYKIPASNNGKSISNRPPRGDENEVINKAKDFLEKSESKVIVLADGDDVVYAGFKYPANESKLYLSASVDKTITALSAGVAICDGKLSASTRAEDLIPQLRGTVLGKSSLEDNLKMASGTVTSLDDSQSETLVEIKSRMSGKTNFIDLVSGRLSKPEKKLFGNVKQGDHFDYKSQDPLVVGMMISAAYGLDGKNLRAWQEKNFWTKVGTNDRIIQGQDQSGYAQSDGNTRLSIGDWVRFANFVTYTRKKSDCMGDFVRTATTTQIKTDGRFAKMYKGYGYFTWTDNTQLPNSFSALGYGGQSIIWNTTNDKFVIVFSNQGNLTMIHQITKEWFEAK